MGTRLWADAHGSVELMDRGNVMTSEGVTLIMRAALVLCLILAAAFFRALVGPSRKRGQIMLAGTLGGISVGVFVGYLISPWLKFDASSICASVGIVLGWGVSWLFVRQIPREAT
jgi:hypothetical protein